MIKIFNTIKGKKEVFQPRQKGHVGIYVCGVTVYDKCHLGHARSAIVFDMIRRYFEFKGEQVTYVKNYTDVDDKIINRAQEEGRPWKDIAAKYIKEYENDMKRLGVLPPQQEPKATEHIEEMKTIISKLMEKNTAYAVDGDVFFAVNQFPEYGKLSKRNLEEMMAGARVEVDSRKRNPLDFALWKSSKPGEPTWESPWGPGRPGWHIECSAMSMKYLGENFDIHGGGQDLIFPHHENEIAQSEGASGKPFAHVWIHNGFVNVNKEKMSKSLGNFFTIEEIFKKSSFDPLTTALSLRYFLLLTHYRSPIEFSKEQLDAAKAGIDRFKILLLRLNEISQKENQKTPFPSDETINTLLSELEKKFEEVMEDDFNTPQALAALHECATRINALMDEGISSASARKCVETLQKYFGVLGFEEIGTQDETESVPQEIEQLAEERNAARTRKDWTAADRIRKQLEEKGFILEDRPDGTTRVRRS
jgi:cysteinyl-tRNA synthetase